MKSAIRTRKQTIRNQMLRYRDQMHESQKLVYDEWICESLWKEDVSRRVKTLHTYLPMGSEMDISPFIEKCLEKGLVVVVPKTLPKRRFENLILTSLQAVENGVFGTIFPSGNHTFQGVYDMMVIPGLAYDSEGYRLGYGGGYYDTFLAKQNNAFKIGICYPFQKMESLPKESHDIQLDKVLSTFDIEDGQNK